MVRPSPESGRAHATELFNPTFLHYIGIPYVHFSFPGNVNTSMPVLAASVFSYMPQWGKAFLMTLRSDSEDMLSRSC